MAHIGKLPNYNRFITGHDNSGKAVFSTEVDETGPWTTVQDGSVAFSLGYTTSTKPVEMNKDQDINKYKEYLASPPGLVEKNGTILRFVDMGPGTLSPMHRTVSLDYGVVIYGEVECVLDSGETRLLKPGDIAIQRGTNHAWRNVSETEWARMMYVLQPSLPVEVDGKQFEEDLGHMEGVRASS